MSFLDSLEWRQAEKAFDPTKKVSKENLVQILEAIHMTPTSYGLQPFHTYVVTNPDFKTQMRTAGYNQSQFENASHILVFATQSNAEERIDQYLELASNGNPEIKQKLEGYIQMMKGDLLKRTPEQVEKWARNQTYIALGFAMAACAELHIDSCPIEGFQPEEFNKILNLPIEQKATVVLAIGYRSQEPKHPKVRFSQKDLFTHLD